VATKALWRFRQTKTLPICHTHLTPEIIRSGLQKEHTSTLEQLQSQREEASQKLTQLQARVKQLQGLASTSSSPVEIKQVVREVGESINALNDLNRQSATQSEEATQNLQALSARLAEGSAPLPAFAIIASYQTRQGAIDAGRELQTRKLEYPVEVYQRDPRRFALTLGGYLTPEEANKRVSYAKQQGLSKDAYVRSAKDWGSNLLQ